MSARSTIITVLLLVVGAHTLLLVDALTTGLLAPRVWAADSAPATGQDAPAESTEGMASQPRPSLEVEAEREVYLELIDELRRQKSSLDERGEALDARTRRIALRETELDRERQAFEEKLAAFEETRAAGGSARGARFERLLKAYAAMEAENAAGALEALHGREKDVVVDLLLGLNARQAGAVLDALAARSPAIAAEVSLAIWKKEGQL